jgi:hypothetical protein
MRRAAALGLAACTVIAGCSVAHPAETSTPSASGGTSTAAVSEWWRGGADYCGLLRDTLHAGASVFGGASAADPAVRHTTSRFLTAVQRAAPPPLAADWRVVGGALQQLMSPSRHPVEAGKTVAVRRATAVIAADARRRCGLSARALG